MNEASPVHRPIRKPKPTPVKGQARTVVDTEQEAHRRLATDETGNGAVDVAENAPDRISMVTRQPTVDTRDHAVPVEQDIEGHNRGDDEDAEDAQDCLSSRPDRGHEAAQQRRSLADIVAKGFLNVL